MAMLNKVAECALAGGIVFRDDFVINALREFFSGCVGAIAWEHLI